jgi:hypothetical protein
MINHDYHNFLVVASTDIDQLDSFVSKAISLEDCSGCLTFSNFLPCPDILDRYTWRLENWGSCCEPFNIEYTRDDYEFVEYSFVTVENSPIAFFQNISTSYPNLEFKICFEKPNEGIFGNAKIENGIVTYNDTSNTDIPKYNVKSICLRNMISHVNTVIRDIEVLKGLLSNKEFISFLHNLILSEEMEEILKRHFKEDFKLSKEYNPAKDIIEFFSQLEEEVDSEQSE